MWNINEFGLEESSVCGCLKYIYSVPYIYVKTKTNQTLKPALKHFCETVLAKL